MRSLRYLISIKRPVRRNYSELHLRVQENFQSYSVFDLNVQVESTTGVTGITGKSKTKHPRVPRVPRGLLFLNTQVKNAVGMKPCPLETRLRVEVSSICSML
jgi:hypothetical protein